MLPQQIKKVALKALLALVCALIVWELILENTNTLKPGAVNHPVLGRIYQPGLLVNGTEGYSRTHFNSLGMRGSAIGDKVPGEQRFLILGDSFTEAVQVSDEQMYATVIERLLSAESGQPVRAINGGRSNASPAYYLHLANYYQTTLKPDRVVIQLNDGDFIKDLLDTKLPFYVARTSDGFETRSNYQSVSFPALRPLLELSISRVAFLNLKGMFAKGERPEGEIPQAKPGFDYAPLVNWTIQELKARYQRPILLYIPFINYLEAEQRPSEIEVLVTEAAKSAGLDFVNMRTDFLDRYRTTWDVPTGFNNTKPGMGHMNSVGHELVARRLAPLLSEGNIK